MTLNLSSYYYTDKMIWVNSLIEQAVNKVSIEGGFARGPPPICKNYGTAVKLPCGQNIYIF